MSILLGDNFSYSAQKPLDGRLKYDTLANMKAVADATMYDGCMAYCVATDKTYQWKSTNSVDASTGRWREFSSGGGSYTAGDGIDITNDVISTKQSEEGDIDEIIDVYPQAGELVSIVNAFNRGDIYSTDEKMIGQWYDGKPLYQKTITGTISVDTDKTSKTTTLGNVSEDLDVVASIDGIRQHENKSVFVSLNAAAGASSGVYVCNLFVNSGTGNLVVEANRLADNGRIILATVRYTKATDTAISIGEANEYSTDEKIVGTWVNDKPIYQRVVHFSPQQTSYQAYTAAFSTYFPDSVYTDIVAVSGFYNQTYYNNKLFDIEVQFDTNIIIKNASEKAMWSVDIIVCYTKTTT